MTRRRRITLGAIAFAVVAAAAFAVSVITDTYSSSSFLAGVATFAAIELWRSR